jgi:hypothetical protein
MGLLDSWVSKPNIGAFDFKLMVDYLAIVSDLPNLMLGSGASCVYESSCASLFSSGTGIPSLSGSINSYFRVFGLNLTTNFCFFYSIILSWVTSSANLYSNFLVNMF